MKQIDKRKNGIFECNQNSVFSFINPFFIYNIFEQNYMKEGDYQKNKRYKNL